MAASNSNACRSSRPSGLSGLLRPYRSLGLVPGYRFAIRSSRSPLSFRTKFLEVLHASGHVVVEVVYLVVRKVIDGDLIIVGRDAVNHPRADKCQLGGQTLELNVVLEVVDRGLAAGN